MKKLVSIPTDEQAVLKYTVDVDAMTATVIFSVKENKDSPERYNLTWTFDYSNVSTAELLEQAVRQQKIDGSRDWRGAKDRMDSDVWQDKVWDVRTMLDSGRQKADPATKASNAVAKLSKAERDALFAMYANE